MPPKQFDRNKQGQILLLGTHIGAVQWARENGVDVREIRVLDRHSAIVGWQDVTISVGHGWQWEDWLVEDLRVLRDYHNCKIVYDILEPF